MHHFLPDYCSMDLFVPKGVFLEIPNVTCSEQTIHERLMKRKHGIRLASVFHVMHGTRRFFRLHFLYVTPPPGNKALSTVS